MSRRLASTLCAMMGLLVPASWRTLAAAEPAMDAAERQAEPTADSARKAESAPRARAQTGPDEPPPNHVRTALEIVGGLGAATLWYVIDDRNVLDWDRPSFEQRLNGEAWRFDSNTFALNYVWHPLAGAGMYVLARGNRLGMWPSFAHSLAGSTLWEYVVEFNEKVSINDMVITPLAGLAVGEFFHKLAVFTSDRAASGAGSRALAWSLGLSVHGHRRLDGFVPRAPTKLWHDLAFRYGFGVVRGPRPERRETSAHWLGFHGRFVSLPGYLQPQAQATWFGNGEFASFDLSLSLGRDGIGGSATAETLIAGYHRQIVSSGRGDTTARDGVLASTTALAAGYTYRSTRALGYDDRQGLLHFPAIVSELVARRGPVAGFVGLRARPSVGSMSVPAYSAYRRVMPEGRTKTVLERERYFYGWGFGGEVDARLRLGPVEVAGRLGGLWLRSIEGLDRAQERVMLDVDGDERDWHYTLSGTVRPPALNLELGLVLERRFRASRLDHVETRVQGERWLFELTLPMASSP